VRPDKKCSVSQVAGILQYLLCRGPSVGKIPAHMANQLCEECCAISIYIVYGFFSVIVNKGSTHSRYAVNGHTN
jgi:hypothetical protein